MFNCFHEHHKPDKLRHAYFQEHHVKFEKYKMQDALIQEEEEGQRIDTAKAAAKAAADREKKQRKKVRCISHHALSAWCMTRQQLTLHTCAYLPPQET